MQRRRRWSRAEKEWIVAAAIEPGAVASEVARAAEIYTSQLFRWRQDLCRSSQSAPEPTFSAVTIAPAASEGTAPAMPALSPPSASSIVEIEFAGGARMRIAYASLLFDRCDQSVASTSKPRHHRSDGRFSHLGNLAVIKALDVAQYERIAVRRRQCRDCGAELLGIG